MAERKIKYFIKFDNSDYSKRVRLYRHFWYWSNNFKSFDDYVISRKTTYNFKLVDATPKMDDMFTSDDTPSVMVEQTDIVEWVKANCKKLTLLRSYHSMTTLIYWIRFTDPTDAMLFKTTFVGIEPMGEGENKRFLNFG